MNFRDRVFRGHLDKGERILYVWHKHILILKFNAAKTSLFGIAFPIIFYLLFPQLMLAAIIWLAVGVLGIFYHYLDWYFDAWILTNKGVIDVEYNGIFDMTSTRIDYHMIEGIQYTIKGFLQTMFNYGDITIDKLGAQTSVALSDAKSPKKLERLIMKLQDDMVSDRSFKDHNALKDMLSEMIAYHVQNDKVKPPKKD